jgi:hypothetical protein
MNTNEQHYLMCYARLIMERHGDEFLPDFCDWLTLNAHVYEAFEKEALRIWNSGRRHYSHRTICEHLRHETATQELGSGFKIDHDRVGCLGRFFIYCNPELRGFFTFRGSKLRKAS